MKILSASTLREWIQQGDVVLVDVREPAEYAAEHIEGATLVPLGQVNCAAITPVAGKKLVIYCRKGRRGESACMKLCSDTPNMEIYNLEGGIDSWIAAGLPVVGSQKFFLPLDRQVQLTVGACVLIGSVLGFFLTPLFFILSGFFGLGLMFAGLSGFCGLAHVLAVMPWNKASHAKSDGTSCCSR